MTTDIGAAPHMDEGGLACFKAAVASSQCYLEYGCGGSTVYACNAGNVKTVISVDTDVAWMEKVREKLANTTTNLLLQHCNLGEVGVWGTPINKNSVNDFWKYSVGPWATAKAAELVPDTVLIDGRFRVACFLYSLLSARVRTRILFDDYFDRPHYFVVEKFCRIQERHGRMAVFIAPAQCSVADLVACYAEHSVNWN